MLLKTSHEYIKGNDDDKADGDEYIMDNYDGKADDNEYTMGNDDDANGVSGDEKDKFDNYVTLRHFSKFHENVAKDLLKIHPLDDPQ